MKLSRQLAEDRALRDAALALFKTDLQFIQTDLRQRGLGERMVDRLGEGAKEFLDDAVDYAGSHKSVVTAGLAAVVLWFARGPILRSLEDLAGIEEEPEPEPPKRRLFKRRQPPSGETS